MADALDQQAAFATKFLGTTNLAQRRRYQEDIAAADAAAVDASEIQFARANRAAELADPLKARQVRTAEKRVEQGLDQFEDREERLNRDLMLRQKAFEARKSHQIWAEDQQIIKADEERMMADDTRALALAEMDLRRRGIKRGTEAWSNSVVEFAEKYPNADPKVMQNLFKVSFIDVDPAALLAEKAALEERGIKTKMRYSSGPNGPSFTLTQVDEPKPARPSDTGSLYDKAVRRFNEEGDPEFKAFLEKQVHELRKQMENPAATTTATPAAAGAPKASPAENLVPRKAKDGSVWLFDPTTKQPVRKAE